jgi:hypothetical protein
MNSTNRALNRVGIALLGLVLLVVGAAVAVAALIPEWLDRWMSASATADSSASDFLQSTELGGGESWLLLALPALCVLLIVLLVVFIFRQGLGRTRAHYGEERARQQRHHRLRHWHGDYRRQGRRAVHPGRPRWTPWSHLLAGQHLPRKAHTDAPHYREHPPGSIPEGGAHLR